VQKYRKIDTNRIYDITASKVVRAFKSIRKLFDLGILTEPDYERKKTRLINGLNNLRIAESSKDFLGVMILLLEENTLTNDEIISIKEIVERQKSKN
jgi:hypothetical protein